MATLRFDRGGDAILGTGQGAMNGDLTVAGLIRRGDTASHTMLYTRPSSGDTVALQFAVHDNGELKIWNGSSQVKSPAWITGTTDWWLIAMTRATGTTTPRFHGKNITTDGAWQHGNGGGTAANPASAAGGGVKVGKFQATAGFEDLLGDAGLIAWWQGTILNDTQIETLAANKKTSDWNALTPSSLTELNTLTPTDLKGLVTWTLAGTPLLTGADPTGWTFDGAGVPAPVNSVAPAVTGTAVSGQILTCTTGTWTNSPTGYTYQWKRAGVNISGATSSTYTLVSADKGTSVKCTVTATNSGGSASADSNAVSVSVLDALPDVGDVLIRSSTGWITLN